MSLFYEIDPGSNSRIKKYPWWCDHFGPFELVDGQKGVGPFTLIRYTSNETPDTFNLRCLHSMRKKAYNQLPQKCNVFAVIKKDGTLLRRRYLHNHSPMEEYPKALYDKSLIKLPMPSFEEVVKLLSTDGRGRKRRIDFDEDDSDETDDKNEQSLIELDESIDGLAQVDDVEEIDVSEGQLDPIDEDIGIRIVGDLDRRCSCPVCYVQFNGPKQTARHFKRIHSSDSLPERFYKISTRLIPRAGEHVKRYCPQCLKQQKSIDDFKFHLLSQHRVQLSPTIPNPQAPLPVKYKVVARQQKAIREN